MADVRVPANQCVPSHAYAYIYICAYACPLPRAQAFAETNTHLEHVWVNVCCHACLGQRPGVPQRCVQLRGCQVTITVLVQLRERFLLISIDVDGG